MEKKGNILMQKYEIGKLLGQGTFAKVHHARNLKTGESVAIKIIDKEKVMKVGLIDQIKREISVMRLVKHPNVVQLHEVMASKSRIYFAMEYIRGGELFNKVSDFGLSALIDSKRQDGLLHTTCGTPAYVAPEVINKRGYDGEKADIWSCGVILFVLLAGYLPFHDSNLMEMYRKISKGEFKCPQWFPPEVRKLLSRILDPNPSTRITVIRIMENSWFRKGFKRIVTPDLDLDEDQSPRSILEIDDSDTESCSGMSSSGKKKEDAQPAGAKKPNCLNAFDIISLSPGFDLSGLFEKDRNNSSKCEAWFTTQMPPSMVVSKLEELAVMESFKIKKKDGIVKMQGSKGGRKGQLAIDAEIFEVTPSFHMVEVKKTAGDTMEYVKFRDQELKPSLKDVVWSWEGSGTNLTQQTLPEDENVN
ncbi:UNVERIFIED_CONTAM: CBL-interacting protein kinase [Sesamum radiatum]|uniref:non-specific serine/threonine protein kinase n=1 Tax=Sesamum radiatum TaxID=300843 RepID=A0AAW2K1F3_SESRA